jgi:hypothetical protein
MKRYSIIGAALFLMAAHIKAEVITYPAPAEANLNSTFSLQVRQDNSPWQTIDVYDVLVDEVINAKHNTRHTSMAYFDFSGSVDIRVVSNEQRINEVRIRPSSRGITPIVHGDTLTFSIDRHEKLSIEVNNDIFNNLHLFANSIDSLVPTKRQLKKLQNNHDYIYFGPGYHKFDTLSVESNQFVYIAGGAYVDGVIEVSDAHNVIVRGHGMIYPSKKMGLRVSRSHNVTIDGPFTTQCAVGESDSVTICNVKLMSYYGWGDGFNVFASSNVHYDDVFARTSDDCSTIYCTRLGYNGSCRNILMENSILWADVAHPIEIGLHGNSTKHDVIDGATYRNIDILDMKEKQIDYQGVFAITCGDNNFVKNITFENIRVDNFREGKLIDLRICYNKKYCTAPGLGIENISFKDIFYNGDNSELSLIIGYDDTRMIRGIHFDNLVINGVKISDDMTDKPGWYKTSDMARIFIGEHVENVTFK